MEYGSVTVRIGGADEATTLTPLNMSPDELVSKLYGQGVSVVGLGDTHHPEYAINQMAGGLLESEKSRPNIYFDEIDRSEQAKYDNYARDGASQRDIDAFENFITSDSKAPDGRYYPQQREDYFEVNKGVYETTKKNGTGVKFIDSQMANADKVNAVIRIDNEKKILGANYSVMAELYDKNGKLRDLDSMSENELENIIQNMPNGTRRDNFFERDGNSIYTRGVMPSGGETYADKREQMGNMVDDYLQSLGVDKNTSFDQMRGAAQAKMDALEKQLAERQTDRDIPRDQDMYQAFADTVGSDDSSQRRYMMQMGVDHLNDRGAGRGENEKNLWERIQDGGNKAVRIDIVPTSPEAIAAMGSTQKFAGMECSVCAGGSDNADYTIFVPGNRLQLAMQELQRGVDTPAKQQAAIEALEKAPLELIENTPNPSMDSGKPSPKVPVDIPREQGTGTYLETDDGKKYEIPKKGLPAKEPAMFPADKDVLTFEAQDGTQFYFQRENDTVKMTVNAKIGMDGEGVEYRQLSSITIADGNGQKWQNLQELRSGLMGNETDYGLRSKLTAAIEYGPGEQQIFMKPDQVKNTHSQPLEEPAPIIPQEQTVLELPKEMPAPSMDKPIADPSKTRMNPLGLSEEEGFGFPKKKSSPRNEDEPAGDVPKEKSSRVPPIPFTWGDKDKNGDNRDAKTNDGSQSSNAAEAADRAADAVAKKMGIDSAALLDIGRTMQAMGVGGAQEARVASTGQHIENQFESLNTGMGEVSNSQGRTTPG